MASALLHEKNTTDFDAIRLGIASPDRILEWSHGEVMKPETINYRTQKPEKDGLFCEKIFGPTKDWECYCGKYKGMHYRGVVCDRCGVLVARSIVRRERMGHISLAVPVTHIWFLRGIPSTVGLLLNMTYKNLEKIVYFANYVITEVDIDKKQAELTRLEDEFKEARENIKKKFEAQAENEEKLKELAEDQSQELNELEVNYKQNKSRIDSINPKALLTENEYRELSQQHGAIFKANIGANAIEELLSQIDLEKVVEELAEKADNSQGQKRKKILKRLKKLEGMLKAEIKPEWLIMKHVPVIPPDLRPMVQLTGGRFATSDLNDLYRRVINRNNRLRKLIEMGAPEVIQRNEMRMLQEAVDALIDNSHTRSGRAVSTTGGRRKLKSLTDMLRGKQGRFRQNLLGKRVDYSGRSVIVSGPELAMNQCGLPKMMALELFKPFVIGRLIETEQAHNVKAAGRMIEQSAAEVWDALDEVIKNKYVLLNRAPTLHRLGVQAFQPILIEGKAIQLHPLVCKGFNADFDGDQMAVHLPLSDAAQQEAREIMSADKNLLRPSDGEIIVNIDQDMVLGSYYITYPRLDLKDPKYNFSSSDEAYYAYEDKKIDIHTPINVVLEEKVVLTTIGRLFFNEVLPKGYPFQNDTFGDKQLQSLMAEVFNQFGEAVAAQTADNIKALGFKYSTVSGLSTGMDDYTVPEEKKELIKEAEKHVAEISRQYEEGLITNDERYRLTIDVWRKVTDETQDLVKKTLYREDNSTSITVVSGARAKLSAVSQISGMLGLVQDVYGETIELPIRNNYKHGLTPVEYFSAARGSRKGLIDTALKTADSGYLTRRMVDVAQDVFTIEEDCGDKEGRKLSRSESEDIGVEFGERLMGRFAAKDIKVDGKAVVKGGEIIDREKSGIIGSSDLETVNIRSVLKCKSLRGICRKCYGLDLGKGEMVALRVPVGVIAAQAVGEPGTQLTLRTFHKGGVAGADITHGLPRIEELLEARNPKGQAVISEIDGTVYVRESGNNYILRVVGKDTHVDEYLLKGVKATIKSGQDVKKGDVIAKGKDKKDLVAKEAGSATVYPDRVEVMRPGGEVREYTSAQYRGLSIKDNDTVTAGQRLTPGSLNLHDLLKYTDEATVQRYIMTEIQSIFSMQGQTIADKHLEVIVRQMFSRVQIADSGDSLFVTGDIVSRATVIEENEVLTGDDKEPATYRPLLLGLIKVSTFSDSFLSAASFQDTTRVLINAATSGRVDELYGLKENVIIGRQIPVGTGYHGMNSEAEEITEVEETQEVEIEQ